MEFKGTKGGWIYKKSPGINWFDIETESGYNILRSDYLGIEQTEANAQLISCSLEMLKLLQEIAKENVSKHYFKINELIKKATTI